MPTELPQGRPSDADGLHGIHRAKPWKTVADAIQNSEDRLIGEGFAAFDPGLEGMAVFATNTTTTLLQQQKRQPT